VNGIELHAADAAAVSGEEKLVLTGVDSESSEILLIWLEHLSRRSKIVAPASILIQKALPMRCVC